MRAHRVDGVEPSPVRGRGSTISAGGGLSVLAAACLATPALALDCGLAKSPIEKTICADPTVRSADDAMGLAFSRAKATLDAGGAAALLANQRRWLKLRNDVCESERATQAACLKGQDEDRARTLDAKPLAGPGTPGRLVPAVLDRPGTKTTYDVSVFLYRFADPKTAAEKALNADVRAVFANAPRKTDDASGTFSYSFSRSGTIAYASDRLLSIRVEGYTFTGGAHGDSASENINIDMASGRDLTFDDLLPVARQGEVEASCAKQVAEQMKGKLKDDGQDPDKNAEAKSSLKSLVDGSAEGIAAVTPQLGHWTFGADAATVDYDADQIAPHALGAFSCALPYATLRPLAKPTFPLP